MIPFFRKPKPSFLDKPVIFCVTEPPCKMGFNGWSKWINRTARKIQIDSELFINRRVDEANSEAIRDYLEATR